MIDTIKQLEWRYAVKKFDENKLLDQHHIEILKKGFNLTATSYGLQPISLVIVKNKELQQQLITHSFDQKQVAQASHVLVICIQSEIDDAYINNYFAQVKKVRGTSDEILTPFREALLDSFSKKDVQEVKEWSKNQAYLAMGNLLTLCAIEQLDACPMEGFQPDAYDKILGLKEKGLTSVLVMPVGYRSKDDVFASFKKVRKEIGQSIIEILD